MNTPEHVFALFIEANPVADPDVLDGATEPEGETMHVVDREEQTKERRPSDDRGGVPPRWGWKPAMVAAVVVLLVGVVGLAALLSRDTPGPVTAETADIDVVFDGSSCSYSGPSELFAGDAIVGFERTPGAAPVALVITRLRSGEDAVDLAGIEEWAATQPAQLIPPWAASFDSDYLTDDVMSLQTETTFDAGRYMVSCNTSPLGTNRIHVGTILTVTSR